MIVMVYTPSAAASFEASHLGAGTSTSLNSGSITTSGTDGVAFGGYGEYGGQVSASSEKINAVVAEDIQVDPGAGNGRAWARRYSSGFTGAATLTLTASWEWLGSVMAFQISGGGAQTINLAFISSGEQLFTPTVKQNVQLGAIATGEQIFSPAVTLNLTPGFIASGEQIFAPTVSQNVTLSAIASSEQVFAPAISQKVLLGTIASGEQVFSFNASFGLVVTLGFISSEEAVAGLTVSQNVLLPAIATGAQVFAATVSTLSTGDPQPVIDITVSFSGALYEAGLSGSNFGADLNGRQLAVDLR